MAVSFKLCSLGTIDVVTLYKGTLHHSCEHINNLGYFSVFVTSHRGLQAIIESDPFGLNYQTTFHAKFYGTRFVSVLGEWQLYAQYMIVYWSLTLQDVGAGLAVCKKRLYIYCFRLVLSLLSSIPYFQ